jgi:hypothetical protein
MTEIKEKIQFELPQVKVEQPTLVLAFVGSAKRFREWMDVISGLDSRKGVGNGR